MKSRLLCFFLIYCSVQTFSCGDLWAQTFTSNSNGAWSTAGVWTRTNPGLCLLQHTSPPPTNPSSPSCAINVIVNHSITRAGDTQFAQQFRSLQVRSSGHLNFIGNTNVQLTNTAHGAVETIIDGGTLEVHNLELSNGATLRVINGGRLIVRNNLTTSGIGSNRISVDATSSITVANLTTIASTHLLDINGELTSGRFISNSAVTTIGSSAKVTITNDFNLLASGSLTLSGNAILAIGQDFISTGSATLISNNEARISTGRNFSNSSSGNFHFNSNSALTIIGNFSNQNGPNVRFTNDAKLAVGGAFSLASGTFLVAENSRVAVTGTASHTGGTFTSSNYADIRIKGSLSSTGGSFNASGYSFLSVGGNHTVTNYTNTFNLSRNAQIQVNGTTTDPWNTLFAIENSCYKSANRVAGVGCVLCGATYTTDGTFTVPAGVTSLTIETLGGGGAGGSADNVRAGGGGGGAYSKRTIAVTPAQTLYIVTGRGAVAGSGTPSAGGTTYVAESATQSYSSALIFARGGNTPAYNSRTGAPGGAAMTVTELSARPNSISYSGGDGASSGDPSGGGGSAAANNANGNNGQVPNGGIDPPGIGGPGGSGNYYNTPGNAPPAGTYGGGGGGANGVTGELKLGGNGANGVVIISFTCPETEPCSRVIEYGLQGQQTIVEYFCNGTWTPPAGLKEYFVSVIGGGGGGGYGNSAGGGGGGAITMQTFSNINIEPASETAPAQEIGIPPNTTFNVTIGKGGTGATSRTRSASGGNSALTGTFLNYNGTPVTHSVVALGGGGGGSNIASQANGLSGGSGGGGAMFLTPGPGGSAGNTGLSRPGASGSSGSVLGIVTSHGGGGGGAGSAGTTGSSSGLFGSRGGNGGVGALSGVPSRTDLYAAGGGGTSSAILNLNSTAGVGGTGGGGTASNAGVGNPGLTNTGSGGGAGFNGGGDGGSGRIFINYSIYSILPVEFISFTATYQNSTRSGLLNWTTAKEWENDRFEIERSVDNVKDWETIGQVKGAGYSDEPLDYTYWDLQLPLVGGTIFYRLKQRDYQGDTSYSDTKSIRVDPMAGTSYWRVYPNPSTGDPINLELMNSGIYHDEIITVRVIASTGQYDVVESLAGNSLNALVSDKLKTKAPGVYTIEISWGHYREYHKVILTR
jgi:hypothetical protein